jgi:hypothetical protein
LLFFIAQNLPGYLDALPAEVKREARYLSKFVIGAGSGLFDYALINAIWNEVVIDLRKKASLYGLDIFFDGAVGVLALTKLNYNTCRFGDGRPITLKFADAIGEVLVTRPVADLPPLPFMYYI